MPVKKEDSWRFMQRCLELAQLGAGTTSPNPMVGAVLVVDGKIIGEGFHAYAGGPHAEINAINSVKNPELLSRATLYVSLEPCNHFGKTPPCALAILQHKIPKVVISVIDPNPLTAGKSVQQLQEAGVEVVVHQLPEKGQWVLRAFSHRITQKRPWVILKLAQSSNQKIGVEGEQVWLTNDYCRRLTHKWRSEAGAILVGTNTLLTDNPSLDNRFYFGASPLKIVLSRTGQLPDNPRFLQSRGEAVMISEKKLADSQYTCWQIPFDDRLLPNLLFRLYERGVNSLLVEGGAGTIQHFINQNLWDEYRLLTSPAVIHHPKAIATPAIQGTLHQSMQLIKDKVEVFRKNQVVACP